MCLSVQLYYKLLGRSVHWTRTAAFNNFLKCSPNFHDFNHFLLDYKSQICTSILDLFYEYQGFLSSLPSKQLFSHYMCHNALDHLFFFLKLRTLNVKYCLNHFVPNSYLLNTCTIRGDYVLDYLGRPKMSLQSSL